MPDDRFPAQRPRPSFNDSRNDRGDRPPFVGGPNRGFPRPASPPVRSADAIASPSQTLRLEVGDRKIELVGSAGFVRQILEDLPMLIARLAGDTHARPAGISMPPAPARPAAQPAPAKPVLVAEPTSDPLEAEQRPIEVEPSPIVAIPSRKAARAEARAAAHKSQFTRKSGRDVRVEEDRPLGGNGSLEKKVLSVLARAEEPLAISSIRERLGDATISGQQVRRVLERAGDTVVTSADRPATYTRR